MGQDANDHIGTTSVSVDVVETDPIVLRETERARLVFLPTLVERDEPLRGCFVYQRRAKGGEWEDIRGERLSTLKSGEGWVLELHTGEVAALMDGLLARKQIYERHGIRWGERVFIDRDSLPQIVRSLIDSSDTQLAEALAAVQPEAIIALGRKKVDLSQLDALLEAWPANADNADEDYWQQLLAEHRVGAKSTGFRHQTGQTIVYRHYARIFSANRSRAAWRDTPSAIPISPHDRWLARARATSSRTRASPARTLSTASARVRRSVVSSIGTVDGSNSSASFAARWVSSSVCMAFAPVIGGVGIGGGLAWRGRSRGRRCRCRGRRPQAGRRCGWGRRASQSRHPVAIARWGCGPRGACRRLWCRASSCLRDAHE
jgi:hypothetical protein